MSLLQLPMPDLCAAAVGRAGWGWLMPDSCAFCVLICTLHTDHDVVRTLRTTLYVNIICLVHNMSYVYDMVCCDVLCSNLTSVLY